MQNDYNGMQNGTQQQNKRQLNNITTTGRKRPLSDTKQL